MALDCSAASGDVFWVAKGVYRPALPTDPSSEDASFVLKDGVKLYGGFAGTETTLEQRDPKKNVTVLTGDLASDDAHDGHGVTVSADRIVGTNSCTVVSASYVGAATVLDGFTICGGENTGGGGMYNYAGGLIATNCILWGDGTNVVSSDGSGSLTVTYSIVRGGWEGPGNRNEDPRLGALGDNGGATWTHALLSGSPAIDAGTPIGAPAADQRGVSRPYGPAVDIGAFELNTPVHTITASADVGGSISPSGAVKVTEGGSQTFAITADSGYRVKDVKVGGVSVGSVLSYTITNVTKDITVLALFEKTSVVTPGTPDPTPEKPVAIPTSPKLWDLLLAPGNGAPFATISVSFDSLVEVMEISADLTGFAPASVKQNLTLLSRSPLRYRYVIHGQLTDLSKAVVTSIRYKLKGHGEYQSLPLPLGGLSLKEMRQTRKPAPASNGGGGCDGGFGLLALPGAIGLRGRAKRSRCMSRMSSELKGQGL